MKFTTVFLLAAGAMTVSAQNNTIGGGSGTSNSSSPSGTGTPPPPIATGGAAHLTALSGAVTIAGLVAVMFTF
ncbi:hypothetical protein AA313_de0209639 [Arthrobotrys entomopaga]|nr:hypothetical protein AA313_de0209639 [Arthrobotrys entomopaga]